jgi:UDPglucose 6-dehydrogenase
VIMDEKSAEMTKYAANSYLATRITFMNEIANICEKVGADVNQVRIGMGSDSRIGKRFLFPGIGYGGSCFPKDVKALAKTAAENTYDFSILNAVMNVNEKQKTVLIPKLQDYFKNQLKGKKIALWGLAFKPNTDDIREAPALDIIESLLGEGAEIVAYDPEAMENTKSVIGDRIAYAKDELSALDGADALIIATEWPLFRNPEFNDMAKRLKNKAVFDGRNLYDPATMKEFGFYYASIGRQTVK